MLNNEKHEIKVNDLKRNLEKATGMMVKSLIDLDEEYFVVVFKTDYIPGKMYKISKNTGEVSYFVPPVNDKNFVEAVKNRSKIYD